MKQTLQRLIQYHRQFGLRLTILRLLQKTAENLLRLYDRGERRGAPGAAELAAQRAHRFAQPPLISIVVPVYNVRPAFLRALVDSVLAQTYPRYELCLADGASPSPETARALEEAAGRDPRIRVERLAENLGISGNTNAAIRLCGGDYVALLDHDDLLTPDALYHVARAIEEQGADLLYSDEDKTNEDASYLFQPHIKPDFSPDRLRSYNYICHLMVLKKTLLFSCGLLDPAFDGSQDHELALRASERAEKIVHIPRVLYHWRQLGASMSHQSLAKCQDAMLRATRAQLERLGVRGRVDLDDLRAHVRIEPPAGLTVTFIVAGDGGEDEARRRAESLPAEGQELLRCEETLPRFAAFNRCAQRARGEVLVFVAAELARREELPYLLGRAAMPDAGAIAATIAAPNGAPLHKGYRVEHGGVRDIRKKELLHDPGFYTAHNVTAASCEFLAVRREAFLQAGMFDEGYARDFADAALCIRLREMGLHNVISPECVAIRRRPKARPDARDAARFAAAYPRYPERFDIDALFAARRKAR